VTNADNFLILPEGRIGTDFAAAGVGARFHKGFMSALAEVWEPLLAAVEAAMKAKERPLWVTGHSLGGALALLAAWRLQQNFIPVFQVTTFGAPMVGNQIAAEAFQKEFPGKIARYVDGLDLVPHLPTVSLIANTYTHCMAEELLNAAAGDPAHAVVKGLAGRAADGLLDLTLMDEIWGQLQQRIAHHMMDNYQARIEERLGKPA
jgi:alpha-beta hydrolase superfamily lysophospholipase